MLRTKALLIALEPWWSFNGRIDVQHALPCGLHRVIADWGAMGAQIVVFASADALRVTSPGDRVMMQELVRESLSRGSGRKPNAIVLMEDATDPTELWSMARKHDVDLQRSVLLSEDGLHHRVARIAGVSRAATLSELERAVVAA